ncbi:DHA2 family efflux MFS transporter permease subunit [Sporolactobacillus shoreae]|uniref:DHA2 family efflux MFS transporter permease subunit n=1 Tax=Sporolactobacillus shoreae TaxID=1465501 RepID=A0A4Z0GQY7_9BACL|nr:DHA2 family efflux MFS transporter permease subunit [Sporolactobacillus shoreae]TGA98947.1 DHA2 family efflux MFS transporter permease subunit [Sporolactobacillus shoreae]
MKNMRKWLVLFVLALSTLAVGIDSTVLNLALPTLASKLNATNSELQWFVDSYNLVFAATLIPAGLLGDRFGRKKMLILSLGIFGLSSLLCAYAASPAMLIVYRCTLALGAATLIPTSMSIIPVLFTKGEQPKATAIWVIANTLSMPIGPIIGGWLLNHFWWGSVFLINVPIVLIALIAVTVLMTESKQSHKQTFDLLGIATSSLGLTSITYGVILAGEKSWSNAGVWYAIILGVILLVAFVMWELKCKKPLINLSLFKSRSFSLSNIFMMVISYIMFGYLYILPQYFQNVEGSDTQQAGFKLLPLILGITLGSIIVSRIHLNQKMTITFGFILLIVSGLMGWRTAIDTSYGWVAVWTALAGVGIGAILPATMSTALADLSPDQSGIGSSVIKAIQQIGSTFGVATLGTVLISTYQANVNFRGLPPEAVSWVKKSVTSGIAVAHKLQSQALVHSVRSSFVLGMNSVLFICGVIACCSLIVVWLFLRTSKAKQVN